MWIGKLSSRSPWFLVGGCVCVILPAVAHAVDAISELELIRTQRRIFGGGPGIANVLTILLLVIGPAKVIPAFARLTKNADTHMRRRLAFRSFLISLAAILLVAIVAQSQLEKYRISLPSLFVATGLVLALVSFPIVMAPYKPEEEAPPPEQPTLGLAIVPLSFPIILPPYGIGAVMLLMTTTARLDANTNVFLALIAGVMVLNLVSMLAAQFLMRFLRITTFQVTNLALAIIQLALGIAAIFAGIEMEALTIGALIRGG